MEFLYEGSETDKISIIKIYFFEIKNEESKKVFILDLQENIWTHDNKIIIVIYIL